MTTTTTAARGIRGVRCPSCNGEDCLAVRVHDGVVHCFDCDEIVTAEELEARAAAYLALAKVEGRP